MWARKRIEIKTTELVTALYYCVWPQPASRAKIEIAQSFKSNDTFTCLSVRSGFDLLLQTVGWQPGSQIIFSGLTIRDMPRIAKKHRLMVVGADVDWKSLSPSAEEIESKITPKTRAIVIAHLMGGQCEMKEIADLAKRNNLMLIEDCAQAYVGNHECGSKSADVSMFSFGSIKTNTALGGAVLFVRDPLLKEKLEANHRQWPIQPKREYLKKILKYAFVKTISSWPIAAAMRLGFRAVGSDHDSMAAGMAKGFAGEAFFDRIRKQPSDALLSLLAQKIRRFDSNAIELRKSRGERLIRSISQANDKILPIGFQARCPTYWVFAVMVDQPKLLVNKLWSCGFDATTHSSLQLAIDNSESNTVELPGAKHILRHIVFLPLDLPMPKKEIERLGNVVGKFGCPIEGKDISPT